MSKQSTFSKRFKDAAFEDQTWKPEICMPSHDGVITDFIPMLNPSTVQKVEFRASGFPPHASFCFHGYEGNESSKSIIENIKESAFGSGSVIRHSTRSKSQRTKERAVTVDFFCIKHKVMADKNLNLTFNDHCIQANGTIIQPHHMATSIKNKSRSSNLKVVAAENQNEGNRKKRRKRSTCIRPMEKDCCCGFGFVIFCSAVNSKWYLSFNKR